MIKNTRRIKHQSTVCHWPKAPHSNKVSNLELNTKNYNRYQRITVQRFLPLLVTLSKVARAFLFCFRVFLDFFRLPFSGSAPSSVLGSRNLWKHVLCRQGPYISESELIRFPLHLPLTIQHFSARQSLHE